MGRLIDNAIKFSRPDGDQVTVCARRAGDRVEVAVTDEGVGISAEKLHCLFERFRQIGRQEMEQQGMGLGLAIAWRLIELHHGEITVESAAGEGSTFTIRLPTAATSAEMPDQNDTAHDATSLAADMGGRAGSDQERAL